MYLSSYDLPSALQTDISNNLAYILIESLKLLRLRSWFSGGGYYNNPCKNASSLNQSDCSKCFKKGLNSSHHLKVNMIWFDVGLDQV